MLINSSWKWCSYSASCSNVWSSRPIIWLWFDSNSTAWFDSDTGLEIDRFFSCLFNTFLNSIEFLRSLRIFKRAWYRDIYTKGLSTNSSMISCKSNTFWSKYSRSKFPLLFEYLNWFRRKFENFQKLFIIFEKTLYRVSKERVVITY